ncbi:hypothetical protein PFAG_04164 [Plasmodium falciparum Santa Lucia]|uniref:GPI transamidase component PIG-S n=8 Tax=Plasmodium falciparum TaxID=5833 RepID=A0A024W3A1_PLAFA|nr:hypothetical protein PFFCH_02780 [Plasmodium falciparum FCH/4]ETW35172.1 hypothetical protein PFTANZ_04135 [Plasmodium falciparum Tanzania (2000708)]ETW41334.1 hypothetical protein PFNF135_04319 [Plasmodium falciparum NF135/5.C10]ETW57303.1 hypothetical protein PFUGPA_00792 [Plasmodium falciparum Palo Alto/Uganda]EUT81983.1 hypothetical protein PFAG_04164 [Plasmodium falciparum Santa Lucia]EWC75093.1 hypothetical protein C923_04232 [Plasmodium falciparum UGT5.1]KOB61999.1 hypothetical prot
MNSRTYCVIFYGISLLVYVIIIFFLNRFEKQTIPYERIKDIIKIIKHANNNIGIISNKIEDGNIQIKHQNNFLINLNIVSGCANDNIDMFEEMLKSYIEEKIKLENDKIVSSFLLEELNNVQDIFTVTINVINKDMIKKDTIGVYSNICNKLLSKNMMNDNINNNYYLYIIANEKKKKEKKDNLSFTLSTTNILELYYNKVEENSINVYQQYIYITWDVLKNTFLDRGSKTKKKNFIPFVPELDLNFFLASCLYNKLNYKIGRNTTGGVEMGGVVNDVDSCYEKDCNIKHTDDNEDINKDDNEDINKANNKDINKANNKDINKANNTYINKANNKYNIHNNRGKTYNPPLIAVWDFYKDFYYPYIRPFIERLLYIYQINIYPQILSNINMYEISDNINLYIEEKEKGNARLIILDKITKFTNIFDEITFDNVLSKPTYEVPKNINFMVVFPNGDEIYFYNNLSKTNKIETAVSIAEWGTIYINNEFTQLKDRSNYNNKNNLVNISNQAHVISGIFISHFRSLLGLCSNFSDCIYNIFNSDTYNIKYIETISSEIDSYISYIISEENNLSFSFFYHIPLKNSISNYELLALIRQAYTYHIMETIQNLYKFLSISKISIYMKVPYYTLTIFNNILNNIECSLIYMQGRICGINHIDKIVEEKFKKENDDKEKDGEELFFKAALMLAQSAYQDSLQLLGDDKISIYDILSKDFMLASFLPVVIPFGLPIICSVFQELIKYLKKRKTKID